MNLRNLKKAEIRSKHGTILSCTFDVENTHSEEPAVQELARLGKMFEGKRYGFTEDLPQVLDGLRPHRDVLTWMREVTTA